MDITKKKIYVQTWKALPAVVADFRSKLDCLMYALQDGGQKTLEIQVVYHDSLGIVVTHANKPRAEWSQEEFDGVELVSETQVGRQVTASGWQRYGFNRGDCEFRLSLSDFVAGSWDGSCFVIRAMDDDRHKLERWIVRNYRKKDMVVMPTEDLPVDIGASIIERPMPALDD